MSYIEDLFDIRNRVYILTGGGGVLAGAIGEGLARAGARVVLLDIRLANAQERAEKIIAAGGKALALESNVLDVNVLEYTKDIILQHYGRIDGLINLAGGNMPGATISP